MDSQEPSPIQQLESVNSLALNLFHGPTLTSVDDYWKNHNLDYPDLYQQSGVSAFTLCRLVIAFLPRGKHL